MSTRPTIADLARQIHAEERGNLPADPEARADAVARRLREERPDIKVRSAQDAAARAVGVETITAREKTAEPKQPRPLKLASGPRRRGVTSLGLRSGKASVGGLIAQALGLVALYWLLRTADVVPRLTAGVADALRWLRDPVPFGG